MTEFATRCVHAGLTPDPSYGSVIPADPPDLDLRAARARRVRRRASTTRARPTRRARRSRRRSGELEGGLACAFSSGMAAEHALITAITSAGSHVVLPDDLYGGTYRLVDKVLSRFGVEYDMVDQRDLDAVARAVRPDTALVWVETPTNPSLNVIDLRGRDRAQPQRARGGRQHVRDPDPSAPARARRRRRGALDHEVPRRALRHRRGRGDRAAIPSCTRRSASSRTRSGRCPAPLDCFLVHRGLRTLHLRMAAHDANGLAVSSWLREEAGIEDVRWPGFSGMVSFRHPDAIADRRPRPRSSRSPSRWAGSSR